VVRQLVEQGRRVRAIDLRNDSPLLKGLDIEFVEADVTDPAAVSRAIAGAAVVYHLAAIISLQEWERERMRRVNVEGVKNVVEACLQGGVRRLIHFTSIHALASSGNGAVVDETAELALAKHLPAYDRSKAEGLLEVRQGVTRGLDAVMLHPVGVLGPGDHRPSLMGEAIRKMAIGRLPAIVEGGFSWVDVRDVASTAIAAETRGRKGEQYIVGGGWYSAREVSDLVGKASGVPPPRFSAPLWLTRSTAPIAAAFSWVTRVRLPFTPASIHALSNHRHVSYEKARRELGHDPRPFADTITDTVSWFRENGYLR
jgi:dihydroflavonol-4-reductase